MKMRCERPVWTICFFFIWAVIGIAVIITHAALGKTVPAIEDFPDNLVKGFMVVFKFDELKTMAVRIKDDSDTALDKCGVADPTTACTAVLADPQNAAGCAAGNTMDGTAESTSIQGAFDEGLNTIKEVAEDKYLGTPEFADTASSLNGITAELANIGSATACCIAAPAFCTIYQQADVLYTSYDQVKAAIDTFTDGKAVESFKNGAKNLKYLHVLPWILVLSSVFFVIMWFRNGACCCCTNGSFSHCLLLALPQAIFWLLSFIIMLIFAAIGWAFDIVVTDAKVKEFNGDPTVEQVLTHFQDKFPEFWSIVFEELEEGLGLFRTSSTMFVFCCILVGFYSCAFCCCRPYAVGGPAEEGAKV